MTYELYSSIIGDWASKEFWDAEVTVATNVSAFQIHAERINFQLCLATFGHVWPVNLALQLRPRPSATLQKNKTHRKSLFK